MSYVYEGHRQLDAEAIWQGRSDRVWTGVKTPRGRLYAGYRYPAEILSYAVWLTAMAGEMVANARKPPMGTALGCCGWVLAA